MGSLTEILNDIFRDTMFDDDHVDNYLMNDDASKDECEKRIDANEN